MLMTSVKREKRQGTPNIVIIGAGIGGILAGIKLRERGIESFSIYEKASDLGGTWRDNTYPGIACDIPAHLYIYSFEPNHRWSHQFAGGAEILEYYRGVAQKHDILRHIQFNRDVVSVTWEGRQWRVVFADGEEVVADIVIGAVGRLHHPAYPEIADLDKFEGAKFHSARWNHDIDLSDKRVGVIGTGSSATQIIGALAGQVKELKVFQRTPQWVLTWPNPRYSALKKMTFRLFPGTMRSYYQKLAAQIGKVSESILFDGEGRANMARACKAALSKVSNPELREKLTPNYQPGCKRIVVSPNFYEAIQQPGVEVVTAAIEKAEPTGLRTADGALHEIDVLAMATGFQTQVYLRPIRVTGVDGITLDDVWQDGPLSYRSIAIPHMPNFFMINGPYGPNGSASVVGVIEVHVDYVMQCLDHIMETGRVLSPCPDKSASMIEEIRSRGAKTLWATGGCNSWYLDKHGIPLVNPLTLTQLRAEMLEPDLADFVDHDTRVLAET